MADRPKVFVSRYFPGKGMDLLKSHADVIQHNDTVAPAPDALAAALADADAAILYGDSVDAEVLARAPRLKAIADQQGARGVDKDAARAAGITITVPSLGYDWIIPSEAEHAIALILAVSRRIPEATGFVRAGKWVQGEQSVRDMLGNGLYGKTIGIVNGSRRAGKEVAERLQGWQVKLLHAGEAPSEAIEQLGAERVSLDELCRRADYILLMHGDFARAEPYLGEAQFALMKPTAYLASITLGKAIDETALARALKEGRLAGAALDKLKTLGKPVDGLADQPNALFTPHADGSLAVERSALFEQMVEDVLAVLDGQKPSRAI